MANQWWTFLLRSILSGLIGVAALFWPTSSITLLLQVVGALLILDAALTWFGVGRHRVIGGLGIRGSADRAGFADQAASGGLAGLSLMGAMAQLVAIGSLLPLLQMHWQNPYRTAVRIYGIFALTKAVAMFFLAARFRKAGDRLDMRMVNR